MNELQEWGFTHLQYGVNLLWKVQNWEAIIFSTVFDNVILQIGFPVKNGKEVSKINEKVAWVCTPTSFVTVVWGI